MKSNKGVFKSKKGNCVDISEFIAYCLNKAGYKAGTIKVGSSNPWGHRISYYKDKGNIFTIDNGMIVPAGITGPFTRFRDIPYTIIHQQGNPMTE